MYNKKLYRNSFHSESTSKFHKQFQRNIKQQEVKKLYNFLMKPLQKNIFMKFLNILHKCFDKISQHFLCTLHKKAQQTLVYCT